MGAISLKVDASALRRKLTAAGALVVHHAEERSKLLAATIENDAKASRPWKDRTGNARRSITGSAESRLGSTIVYLAIGVKYGAPLELGRGGQYAVVKPTLDKWQSQFLKGYKGII